MTRLVTLACALAAACVTVKPFPIVPPEPRLPAWQDRMSDGCTVPQFTGVAGLLTFSPKETACCVKHDRAYYLGGSIVDRLHADEDLRACFLTAGSGLLKAEAVFKAVRLGGEPFARLPYSWAFGGSVFTYTLQPQRTK